MLAELDRGCHGGQVRMLQHLLNTSPGHRGTLRLDGLFGPRTDEAVRGYQHRQHLAVDGVVGRDTWARLGMHPAHLPQPQAGAATPAPVRPMVHHPIGRTPAPAAPVLARPAHRAPAPAPEPRSVPMPGQSVMPADGSAPWMAVAEAEKWVHEHNPRGTARIIQYHATTCGARNDQVPWCSSFVNWCLKQVGIHGTNNALAVSWAHWGVALAEPRFGCIVQLHHGSKGGHDARTGSSSGNHVSFFVSKDATHIRLLGGNQHDSVRETSYPIASYHVAAMRWPG